MAIFLLPALLWVESLETVEVLLSGMEAWLEVLCCAVVGVTEVDVCVR